MSDPRLKTEEAWFHMPNGDSFLNLQVRVTPGDPAEVICWPDQEAPAGLDVGFYGPIRISGRAFYFVPTNGNGARIREIRDD